MLPPEQFFAVSLENAAFSEKIIYQENIQHLIFDNKGYIYFWRKMTTSPKKGSCFPNIFFPIFFKNVAFSKKLVGEKIFKISFPIEKVIFIFVARNSLPFKRDLAPRNGFLPFSQKIQLFLKKLLSNKIFRTSLVIKKTYFKFLG